jgi:hypothetical protein
MASTSIGISKFLRGKPVRGKDLTMRDIEDVSSCHSDIGEIE